MCGATTTSLLMPTPVTTSPGVTRSSEPRVGAMGFAMIVTA
jgi:hypothetical protein